MTPEQENLLLNRIANLERKVGSVSYPINPNSQGAVEETKFKTLSALKFKGGLPVFTDERTDVPKQGEIYIKYINGAGNLCTYIDGVEYCDNINTMANVREIFLPSEAMNKTTTSGCSDLTKIEAGSNDIDYWVLDFDASTAESCFFTIRMPDNWNASTVTFRFIWTNASGGSTETVDWGIKGRCYSDGDAIDQAYGSEIVTTDTWIAQNDIHISIESSAVTLSGNLVAGNWCQFKITRKISTDNLTGDARLIGIRLKYGIV